jgi:uncharacterized membrane protein YdcZ (DUF606 family)
MCEAGAQREEEMQNAFPDWLFNVLLLGGIAGTLVLAVEVFAAPIVGGLTTVVALVLVLVVAAFWPRW